MRIGNLSRLFLAIICTLPLLSHAQSPSYKLGISLGASYMAYKSHPGRTALEFRQFRPTVDVGVSKYLNGAFDFRVQGTFGPKVAFPQSLETAMDTWMADFNYQMVFKLNNGVIFRESAFLGPYAIFGVGGSFVEGHPDAYFPVGGGMRFKLGPRFQMRTEAIRKISMNQDYQSLAYAVAFVYNLETKEAELPEIEPGIIEEDSLIAEIMPKDRDHDGWVDHEDLCPDEPGVVELMGCPLDSAESILAAVEDPTLEESSFELAPGESSETLTQAEPFLEAEIDNGVDVKDEEFDSPDIQPIAEENHSVVEGISSEAIFSQNDETANGQMAGSPPPSLPNLPCDLPEVDRNSVLAPIYFATGSDQIPLDADDQFGQIASLMRSCSQTQLVLEGHADSDGGERRNMILSVMRAFRVKYKLVYEYGVPQNRIKSLGLGEQRPAAENASISGRLRNRRVEMRLVN
ncbi:OmpA family protein [Pontibacter sp. G13]|uniref:OmpA family protein n=1 Tax=Pontibacter sp. G13 TaxID=3074898 RepID=UPI00288B94B3|nr:OmpA family protein [Pontibacter sp. G13]WNJ18830.1 OmpA family protein [Pontibacter sp. G13]